MAVRLKVPRYVLQRATSWQYSSGLYPPSGLRHYRRTNVFSKQEELFPMRLTLPENHGYVPMLSPTQVTTILALNEASLLSGSQHASVGVVRSFDSNQLSSNNPIEDRRAVSRLVQTDGALFGVFDGHGGAACAQAINERLFEYIAVSLLPYDLLEKFYHSMKSDKPLALLESHRFRNDYVSDDLEHLYRQSLQKFVVETLSLSGVDDDAGDGAPSIIDRLKSAFCRMDDDISAEALPVSGAVDEDLLEVALSGACACTVHIQGLDVHIANIGDCRSVIGEMDTGGRWTAWPLTVDHNIDNVDEAQRVRGEHPKNELNTVFKNDRLLGQLIPLRAFGDVRFKWSLADLKRLISIMDSPYAQSIIPMHYYTPPYLIARPQIIHHRLTKNQKFLVIASDGLWEMMSNERVVEIVGDHLIGKKMIGHFSPGNYGRLSLGEINKVLRDRRRGLAHKKTDANGATHLIRHALGFEHRKVSEMLTFPPAISRHYRDDITVIIVYFDEGYLSKVDEN